MFRVFNMGVGMVIVTDADSAAAVLSHAGAAGMQSWMLGEIVPGSGKVLIHQE